MNAELFKQVDNYISSLLAQEDDALQEVSASIEAAGIPQMSVSPNQGKMLQVLAKMCNARRILEIGTLGGYSTIWLARALHRYGQLVSIEYDVHHAEVAKRNIANASLEAIVDIRVGKALDILPQLAKESSVPFDMIFIDADKQPYKEYFEWALKLSRPGTVIVADNVVREGKVLDKDTDDEKVKGVQRFNEYLAQCTEVTATIMQTVGAKDHDGMAIAVVNQP